MGLNNSFQLTSLLFALLKILFLFSVAFQLASTCHYRGCRKDERTVFVVVAVLMTFFPILHIMGILMKNLLLLRVCKVYALIEKSAIMFVQLVGTFFMGGLMAEYFRTHYMSDRDRWSIMTIYALDCAIIMLIALYMIFRNWMYNGTIESVKQDIAQKRSEQSAMAYDAGTSAP